MLTPDSLRGHLKYPAEAKAPPEDPIVETHTALAAALGVVIGFGVWAAAPLVVGQAVPWDATWPYYSITLLVASTVIGFLLPRRYTAIVIGTALGQFFAQLVLLPLERWYMLVYPRLDWIATLVTIPGAWAGSSLRVLFGRTA